jgi:UV DNA damage endonuclease
MWRETIIHSKDKENGWEDAAMSIGYACLTIGVPGTNLSRCILRNATELNLRKIITANLLALEAMIDYNIENHIRLFRISSDIIPFASHPVNNILWWEDYKDLFLRIGKKIRNGRVRVSMHPGQYTVINSSDEKVVCNAIRELEYHNRFLEVLGMDPSCKLILHIGGVYGNKQKAMETFVNNYAKLDKSIRDRLVIENDDKNYTIEEVLAISKETGAPVVFDNLHHEVNPPEKIQTETMWLQECAKTWGEGDGKQKIHYSLQKEGASVGSHSNTIYLSPFLKFYNKLPNKNIDLMLEVKDKNLSALKCNNITAKGVPIESLNREWDRYKLLVL